MICWSNSSIHPFFSGIWHEDLQGPQHAILFARYKVSSEARGKPFTRSV